MSLPLYNTLRVDRIVKKNVQSCHRDNFGWLEYKIVPECKTYTSTNFHALYNVVPKSRSNCSICLFVFWSGVRSLTFGTFQQACGLSLVGAYQSLYANFQTTFNEIQSGLKGLSVHIRAQLKNTPYMCFVNPVVQNFE